MNTKTTILIYIIVVCVYMACIHIMAISELSHKYMKGYFHYLGLRSMMWCLLLNNYERLIKFLKDQLWLAVIMLWEMFGDNIWKLTSTRMFLVQLK